MVIDFYVMNGNGFNEDFGKSAERNIRRTVEKPSIQNIDSSYLSKLDKGNLVFGGGNGFLQLCSLGKSIKDLTKFIKNGGNAIGFCAGAYLLASSQFDFIGASFDLKTGRKENQKLRIRTIQTSSENGEKSISVPYFGGPEFVPGIDKERIEEEVIATYKDNNQAAMLVGRYGDGTVGLISPHLELDDEFPFKNYEEHFHPNFTKFDFKKHINENQESVDSLAKLLFSKLNISTQ